jgi:hypothetical protein
MIRIHREPSDKEERQVRLVEDLARQLRDERDKCLLGPNVICSEDVRLVSAEVFVAHAYTEETTANLTKLTTRLRDRLGLTFTRAEEILRPGSTVACDICLPLRRAGHFIADLTPGYTPGQTTSQEDTRPNPNVTFEVGLAFAYGKKPILILKRGWERLGNISNHTCIPFDDYDDSDLFDKLVKELGAVHNLTFPGGT